MGGWAIVDPDDDVYQKVFLLRRLDVQMGRPYEVICIRYYYGIFLRYNGDIFVRQKSLHICPTSTFYITYGKSIERSVVVRMFGGSLHLFFMYDLSFIDKLYEKTDTESKYSAQNICFMP